MVYSFADGKLLVNPGAAAIAITSSFVLIVIGPVYTVELVVGVDPLVV